MLLHRLDADAELGRDLLVDVALGDELEQLGFPGGQVGVALLMEADAVQGFLVFVLETPGDRTRKNGAGPGAPPGWPW